MSVTLHQVSVRYGRQTALEGISLSLPAGLVTAVVGPNGSGKSTLLRAIAGTQRHDGTIDTGDATIGHMPQDNATTAVLTAFEVVLLGRLRTLTLRVTPADAAAAEAVMREVGVADLADRRIGTLSGGQRQLVFLAQVLAGDPGLLLLDEPTSALDIAHQMQVLHLLRVVTRRRGLTTAVVLHDLNAAARHADRVALLHQGRLLATGDPAAVLAPDRIETAFGVTVSVLAGPDGQPVVVPLAPPVPPDLSKFGY